MATAMTVVPRNNVITQGFGQIETERPAETASSAVAAREQAAIQARCIMAERHPRNWDTVRVRTLQHCDRPRFAEVARYAKPTGSKRINGQFVEQFAEGLSARFAEVARQEMGNVEAVSSVVFEDDLIRIVRAGVSDIERNSHEYREIAVAKVVEKRGKKDKQGEWQPPEGREIIGNPRINSYGDPVWNVKATEDEIRNRQNSEISKIQRDATLRLMPKDIRDECEDKCKATLADPKKTDPTEARKRLIDGFAALGVMPDDLVNYMNTSVEKLSPAQLGELRGLWTAIRDGETTFNDAMRKKYDTEAASGESDETQQQHDARLQKQMAEQLESAKQRGDADEKAKQERGQQSQQSSQSSVGETEPNPEDYPIGPDGKPDIPASHKPKLQFGSKPK